MQPDELDQLETLFERIRNRLTRSRNDVDRQLGYDCIDTIRRLVLEDIQPCVTQDNHKEVCVTSNGVSVNTNKDTAYQRWLDTPLPNTPQGADARPDKSDDCLRCQCGTINPVWFAANELWNIVMGGPEATDDPGGILCPNCFITKAEEQGIKPTAWKLEMEKTDSCAGNTHSSASQGADGRQAPKDKDEVFYDITSVIETAPEFCAASVKFAILSFLPALLEHPEVTPKPETARGLCDLVVYGRLTERNDHGSK